MSMSRSFIVLTKSLKLNLNWQMLNECPACFYMLKNEPPLEFDWLVSIDGNNSLKRWDLTMYDLVPREDSRTARSDFWISNDMVNRFQYEVKAKVICFVNRAFHFVSLIAFQPRSDELSDD
jgi:hypothetical protein